MESDIVTCTCGTTIDYRDMERVYDCHGIYAGRWCSYECAEKHLNLNYTRQDAAENGENIDSDY